jgi:hypothetical protein
MEERQSSGAAVDRLIEAIVAKLKDKKAVLVDSLEFGRLTWRKRKRGGFEIDLEPKL